MALGQSERRGKIGGGWQEESRKYVDVPGASVKYCRELNLKLFENKSTFKMGD